MLIVLLYFIFISFIRFQGFIGQNDESISKLNILVTKECDVDDDKPPKEFTVTADTSRESTKIDGNSCSSCTIDGNSS